jgi:hypothetical protein
LPIINPNRTATGRDGEKYAGLRPPGRLGL